MLTFAINGIVVGGVGEFAEKIHTAFTLNITSDERSRDCNFDKSLCAVVIAIDSVF